MKNVLTRVAIYLVLVAYYAIIIVANWSKEIAFSWAYMGGMATALAAILIERWGKYFKTEGFDWWELIKKQLAALVVVGPVEVMEIWPKLGQPKGETMLDFLTSFSITFTLVMMTSKAPTTVGRLKGKLDDKKEKKAG